MLVREYAAKSTALSRAVLLGCAVTLLGGCISKDMSDLQTRVEEIKARPGSGVKPLPPLTPPTRYLYEAEALGLRSPFARPEEARTVEVEPTPEVDAEQMRLQTEILAHANKEELERFSIDSLRMVGVIEDQESLWGIVRDPENSVHRVRVGNYVGQNFGKITNISEVRIEIREIVKNAQGNWEERQTELALLDE